MPIDLTADDLRELLDSDFAEPALILDGGRFRVVRAEDVTVQNRPFVVLTREQLREQLPRDREYSESDLELVCWTPPSRILAGERRMCPKRPLWNVRGRIADVVDHLDRR